MIPQEILQKPGVLKTNLVAETYVDPDAEKKTLKQRITSYSHEVLKIVQARV